MSHNLVRTSPFYTSPFCRLPDLGTLALKTWAFSKKIGRFSKFKMDLLKPSPGQKTLENKEKSVLVNPFSRFTKTTDFFTNLLGLKGRGSLMTSECWNLWRLKRGCFRIFISWFSWFPWFLRISHNIAALSLQYPLSLGGGKSTRKNPPKIKKFIGTSFSEQFPLGS